MQTKTFRNHDQTQHQNRVHRTILQIDIALDRIDVLNRQLPDNNRTKTASDKDQRNRERKCKP